ncbi:hypothetical protein T492DRAFT_1022605 [Pavlovales sp. CCMP2436]|nr:hypothetical protein T492DRAFT_1022605 [Pavlovales sp. CCMP2436]
MRRTGAHAASLATRPGGGAGLALAEMPPPQQQMQRQSQQVQPPWGAAPPPLSSAALGSWQLPITSPRAPVVPPDPSTTVRPDSLLSLHKACVRADRARGGVLDSAEFTEQLRRHRVALPAELADKVPARGTVKYAPLIDRLRDLGVVPAY